MKAKKSYGQHFLNREDIAEKIATSLTQKGYSKILEVGPGRGMLTKYLKETPCELTLVEADRDMVLYLKKYYPELKNLISADFLKLNLTEIMGPGQFGLTGNFPYNISSQILFKMLDHRDQIPEMVGMFQKEVAKRVVAPSGSKVYGVISILIQAYYSGEYLFTVEPDSFTPAPKVLSGVIRLTRKENQDIGCDHKLFKSIVKITFGQRRKMLRNTMKSFLHEDPYLKDPFFSKRPEELSVEDFIELAKEVEKRR